MVEVIRASVIQSGAVCALSLMDSILPIHIPISRTNLSTLPEGSAE
jgi:hypothetical protein